MMTTGKDVAAEIAFLARELKTPVITETFTALGDQAREAGWSHEEYLAAVLGRQVASRTANGTRMRAREDPALQCAPLPSRCRLPCAATASNQACRGRS